ncbi:hypothetical protein DFH11DRAFT_1242915 [Phellopilus nigrolimitatus]|nr:hypothetical protein DFH11DRAFT_1242915 [Phellopilus nigrolimitatus]
MYVYVYASRRFAPGPRPAPKRPHASPSPPHACQHLRTAASLSIRAAAPPSAARLKQYEANKRISRARAASRVPPPPSPSSHQIAPPAPAAFPASVTRRAEDDTQTWHVRVPGAHTLCTLSTSLRKVFFGGLIREDAARAAAHRGQSLIRILCTRTEDICGAPSLPPVSFPSRKARSLACPAEKKKRIGRIENGAHVRANGHTEGDTSTAGAGPPLAPWSAEPSWIWIQAIPAPAFFFFTFLFLIGAGKRVALRVRRPTKKKARQFRPYASMYVFSGETSRLCKLPFYSFSIWLFWSCAAPCCPPTYGLRKLSYTRSTSSFGILELNGRKGAYQDAAAPAPSAPKSSISIFYALAANTRRASAPPSPVLFFSIERTLLLSNFLVVCREIGNGLYDAT